MLPKDPETGLKARDRRRRTPARALRRRRLRIRSTRLEAARQPRVVWTGASCHDHPVVTALRDRPAGTYAVSWTRSWDDLPELELVDGPGLSLNEGDWTALFALEYRLRGGRDVPDWTPALRESVLAAEAPWRARCRLPLLDMREGWARLAGWCAVKGVSEPSGLWAYLAECTKTIPAGQNGRDALRRAALGARLMVQGTTARDAQRAVELMGLCPKLGQSPPVWRTRRADAVAASGGLPLELAVERIDRGMFYPHDPDDHPRLARWIEAVRPLADLHRAAQQATSSMPERYLAGAVAWAATLTEPVPELTALADALDADCALEPQVLREVLMGCAAWANTGREKGRPSRNRTVRAVWELAIQSPRWASRSLALLKRLRSVVPTSNRRLAEYTWEGELAIAENLLFRSAALEWESVYGWRNLRPALRPFIRRCLRRTERVADTLAVLKLLHTISTLPSKSIVDAAISAWGPGEGALSRRVAGLSSLLGVSETRELQRLRAWREGLQSQLERAPASRAAALQRKLQSASFADHMDRRLQATLAKTEEMLGLRWLRQCSQDALAAHMKVPTLGSEAVHGVRMALKLRTNRRVAHKLVRAAVRGDADWRLRHPANQAWMADARARGLDVDAWLAPRSLTLHDLVARTSTGPLEDLLMGERFNTCLGLDGCNAHSAVSNAAELNKRVLWVERDGRIVGRKLVGLDLSAGGSGLLGFRLYGEFDPRALLAVDLLAMDLGRATGAPLWDEMASEDLALFTEWYDDGEAAWDWWQHLPREDAVRDACKPEKWDTDPRAATARLALLEPRVWAWALEHKTLPPDVASLAWP